MIIFTELMAGNFHDSCRYVNKADLAEFVVTMSRIGSYTQVVFRMPKAQAIHLKTAGIIKVNLEDLG